MSHIFHRNPQSPPALAMRGEGSFIWDAEGKRYFDGSGGAAVSCIGHAHPEVIDAVVAQMRKLEYAHTSFFTSEPAEQLAQLLARRSPPELKHVYFVSSGSESIEAALKMARQYHVERGESMRRHTLARLLSYHGNTLGALGIGGHKGRRALYQPLLADTRHVSPCFALHYRQEGESDDTYGSRLATELEQTILSLGPETVSAFVAETVVGATAGAVTAVPGYFKKIRKICDRYGVLLILDEVMCGVGRTGTYHAFEQEGIVPDILTLAKGLGGGYQPIAAIMASTKIVGTITDGTGAFQHGHTYVGHPAACAAALAVQSIIERDNLVERSDVLGGYLNELLRARFHDHAHVSDVRGRGLFRAVELVVSRDPDMPFDPTLKLHARIKHEALQLGLLCYPGGGTIDGANGDHVLLAPSYLTNRTELEACVELLGAAIDKAVQALPVK
ncbi:aspartate aminotransferase family protein [Pusillimonas sp. ANT_WB101]|uniref:aspartate aminotransferase family protein n=1 Tax=Pusillimonas sp. ANT_WB101 TaxID=2597356 RepID=UPI0011EEFEF1|nr:aspartate aminotransferase family protein [Pusillimonas sp. ANT_WB101]KAA0910457.1 aspartate aminotransferase family protein [Pusillimonas sp. ANT_WB101]